MPKAPTKNNRKERMESLSPYSIPSTNTTAQNTGLASNELDRFMSIDNFNIMLGEFARDDVVNFNVITEDNVKNLRDRFLANVKTFGSDERFKNDLREGKMFNMFKQKFMLLVTNSGINHDILVLAGTSGKVRSIFYEIQVASAYGKEESKNQFIRYLSGFSYRQLGILILASSMSVIHKMYTMKSGFYKNVLDEIITDVIKSKNIKQQRELLIRYCHDDQIVLAGDPVTYTLEDLLISKGEKVISETVPDVTQYNVIIQPIVFRFFSQIRNTISEREYLSVSLGAGGQIVGFMNFKNYNESTDLSLIGSASFAGTFGAFNASTRNKIMLPVHAKTKFTNDPSYITHLVDKENINFDGLQYQGAPLNDVQRDTLANDVRTTNGTQYVDYEGQYSGDETEHAMPKHGMNFNFEPGMIKSARLGSLMKGGENYAEVNFVGNLNLRGYSVKVVGKDGTPFERSAIYGIVFELLKYCDVSKFTVFNYTTDGNPPEENLPNEMIEGGGELSTEELHNRYKHIKSKYLKLRHINNK